MEFMNSWLASSQQKPSDTKGERLHRCEYGMEGA
jgi:hypothetical protein